MQFDEDILDFAESLNISKFEKVLMVANLIKESANGTPKQRKGNRQDQRRS